jgi:hypothetical protein
LRINPRGILERNNRHAFTKEGEILTSDLHVVKSSNIFKGVTERKELAGTRRPTIKLCVKKRIYIYKKFLSVALTGPHKTEKQQKLPPIYSNPNSQATGDRKNVFSLS